jgi:hypothetical protein
MTTLEALQKIGAPERAASLWGGADVLIVKEMPEKPNPACIYVVSPEYALEISWVINAVKEAFYAEKGRVDSLSKYRFFGRLAEAANRYLGKETPPTAEGVCKAIVDEALVILEKGL